MINIDPPQIDLDDLVDRAGASAVLRSIGFEISPAALAIREHRGTGPRVYRFGRFVRYSQTGIREWAKARLSASIEQSKDPS